MTVARCAAAIRFTLASALIAGCLLGVHVGPMLRQAAAKDANRPDAERGAIDAADESDVAAFVRQRRSRSARVRQRALADALRTIGPDDKEDAALLTAALCDSPAWQRADVTQVLAGIGAAAVPEIVDLLHDDDVSIQVTACEILAQIGPDAASSAPALIAALKSERRPVREAATNALRRIDSDEARRRLGQPYDPVEARLRAVGALMIDRRDWPQLGGSRYRNNVAAGRNIPTAWHPGGFDRASGAWLQDKAKNIKWVARLGSQSYGNPVVSDGKIFVGTNNGAGYLKRYPSVVDLGCLLCFRESDGEFLWQHSSEKLPQGRVVDWPMQGICSSPTVERDRLWFVTNRGEVRCLDADGFRDGKNDGPYKDEPVQADDEADVVWVFDMMKQLGVRQHNMATCAPTIWGDVLFICTSNGVDNTHINIRAPDAPSFIALHKHTGKLLWSDNSPGVNILHGQWSCPVVGVFDGVPQVIFPGGDGWLYSFRADRWRGHRPELLWKFDCNLKTSKWILGGRGTRNNIIAYPVIYDDLLYVAVGQDPEHGEGKGHLWCIDPTRRGDVSPELVVDAAGRALPHRRLQAAADWQDAGGVTIRDWRRPAAGAVTPLLRRELTRMGFELPENAELARETVGGGWLLYAALKDRRVQLRITARPADPVGTAVTVQKRATDFLVPNPNSAVVWRYDRFDLNGNGQIEFEEQMHRCVGSPAIKNDLLVIADFSGLVHCVNAKTGVAYWTCDLLAACWSTPLIVGDRVYIGDEDGDVAILTLSPDPTKSVKAHADDEFAEPIREINMDNSIYTVPVVANDVLYIANRTHLFAIAVDE